MRRAAKETGGPGDRFESEPMDFHRRVRAGFHAEQAEAPARVVRVDGDASIDDIAAEVLRIVESRLGPVAVAASGDNG